MFEAKSVAEYGDSFYVGSTHCLLIFYYIKYLREMPQLRQLNGKFQQFFEESELIASYVVFHFKINQTENEKFIPNRIE